MKLSKRSFENMFEYVRNQVFEMNIDKHYKAELLGYIGALQIEAMNREKPVGNPTRCQDCYYYENSQCMRVELVDDGEHWDSRLWQPDDFCSYAVPREVTIENDGTYE